MSDPTAALSTIAEAELAQRLHAAGAVQFGSFTLKSGQTSPVYLDLRLLVAEPELLKEVARAYIHVLRQLRFDRVAGIPLAALPIATAIALESGWPMVYPRLDAKSHGTRRAVEGRYEPGETVVVVDDVISSGLSKLEAIKPLEDVGLKVADVVVLVDRQPPGANEIEMAGYRLHAVTTLERITEHLVVAGRLQAEMGDTVRNFLHQQTNRKE
jgi:uridine monophosphate synthetase